MSNNIKLLLRKPFFYPIKLLIVKAWFVFATIYSVDKTINIIVNSNKSVIRYGDGEILWMGGYGGAYYFEKDNPNLSKQLQEALSRKDNILICVNKTVFGRDLSKKHPAYNHYRDFINANFNRIIKYIPKFRKYGNANVTWLYRDSHDLYSFDIVNEQFNRIKTIWGGYNILIVEGSDVKFGIGNDLLKNAKTVRRIICPNKDSFGIIDTIQNTVFEVIDSFDLALFILGPTATILAYRCACVRKDKRFIDIGSINVGYQRFCDYYQKGLDNNDDKYSEQIIARLYNVGDY